LENREIAKLLGISERTVERAWRFSKTWLLAELSDGQ
jgi:FixJ family two-component response regulator